MSRIFALLVVCLFMVGGAFAQTPAANTKGSDMNASSIDSDKEAVKAAVERFLVAIGDRDLDALPPMFTENANIGAARIRDGEWTATTYTFEEFHSMLKSRDNLSKYQEPVSGFTVYVERGGLAFVRADATLISEGKPRSNNIDYFTLLKDKGTWKFLSASYVSTPIAQP